jgi:hypothetical protein
MADLTSEETHRLATVARQVRATTARRDELIRQLRSEGATLRAIAAAAELSHTAVARIAAR